MSNNFDLGGVVVATTLAFKEDVGAPAGLAVDYDRFAAHCDFLISNGCRGVGPNGSLGEYSALTDEERRKVIRVAVETVNGRGIVVAGVHGPGWHQAVQWAEYAKEDGADGVLALPPTMYRASREDVLEHYKRINDVGLPIMLYNNPIDTKVDLTPDLIAELNELENVVAVKEFSTDARRVFEIQERCDIQVIAGADDLLFEALVDGAVGWFAGYPNAFPKEAVEIYDLVVAGKIGEAREVYRNLVTVFRWDTKTEFVQAIKLSIDIAGQSYGGPSRPPRGPLSAEMAKQVRKDTQKALDYITSR
ncbi:MAG TPA: dihydrodipicolinate synthase family protein [Arachnia sp.]|nr:dihydrodipicolinate synthase family protein [Arachnia sp.]HMT86532.1 dihydrodipicolinate synthase family protein [Arachnia sp.]